jgi:hypothetical protein
MSDGKQSWSGGEWPGEPRDMVEVWCRGGYNDTGRAMHWDWEHKDKEGDILAYRFVSIEIPINDQSR